jgi:ferredoxin-NADP reductase
MAVEHLKLRVNKVRRETSAITAYELLDPDGSRLPPFTAGAHIDVLLPSGRVRQYSLCNDPSDRSSYCIAVQRETAGRGGSAEIHELCWQVSWTKFCGIR